jgi:biopolymer transport protein ExbD
MAFALVLALGASACAAEAPKSAADAGRVISTLPGIVVDTKAKEVRLEGMVCLQRGSLELLVCSAGTREHEAVVVVKAKPSHVTFALALLGLEPGTPAYRTEGGAFCPPSGAVLDITARFKIEKGQGAARTTEVREVPAWKLLRLCGADDGLDRALEWVYVGLAGPEDLRASDREGTVVCLSNFSEAVIDVPFESTSVNADLLYEANPGVVPPPGTPVELVIKPTGERVAPKKVEMEVVLRKGQPPLVDGKPLSLEGLRQAANSAPIEIRTALVKAEADEAFGRVMEVHDLLRDALMEVTLKVFKPAPAGAASPPAAAPLEIALSADDKVRTKGLTLSLEEFRAKAGELLKDVQRVHLAVQKTTSAKTVAEVMAIIRDGGVQQVSLSRGE